MSGIGPKAEVDDHALLGLDPSRPAAALWSCARYGRAVHANSASMVCFKNASGPQNHHAHPSQQAIAARVRLRRTGLYAAGEEELGGRMKPPFG
jgi:hypothetical protein